jgi:hypothetical protein
MPQKIKLNGSDTFLGTVPAFSRRNKREKWETSSRIVGILTEFQQQEA